MTVYASSPLLPVGRLELKRLFNFGVWLPQFVPADHGDPASFFLEQEGGLEDWGVRMPMKQYYAHYSDLTEERWMWIQGDRHGPSRGGTAPGVWGDPRRMDAERQFGEVRVAVDCLGLTSSELDQVVSSLREI